uniref:Uncharacterized protein n=1 Tax=Chromera velia CCMP2878 TaxID=1169474 RepID=A0A0G4HKY2_9ALVE|eukprot:Cvel_28756.t1-p1 / transcript=Cvel_28756.t1 / gene=Cvel_28756 / organism=Chromera_velia_CCMP2878 / gene_product=hypothetical protein / transcript_product=hypothetical protein / location=Cvel_scaffold3825:8368-9484(-) / protein_length=295 / sequence_SO=supercontig / SO=protein_coding / is_pseudo=false
MRVCRPCKLSLEARRKHACTSPTKRARSKKRKVQVGQGGDEESEEGGGVDIISEEEGSADREASPSTSVSTSLRGAASSEQIAGPSFGLAGQPPTPPPHLSGQRPLVHSPHLKKRRADGTFERTPRGKHFVYKGLEKDRFYPFLDTIPEEGELESSDGGGDEQKAKRFRAKTIAFMNDWTRVGSRKREKPVRDLFAMRHTRQGKDLCKTLHRTTVGLWDQMLGTATLPAEERANALTSAAVSFVMSASVIETEKVVTVGYGVGTGSVRVRVTDCERESRSGLSSYQRSKQEGKGV